jgi:hypothetical protein
VGNKLQRKWSSMRKWLDTTVNAVMRLHIPKISRLRIFDGPYFVVQSLVGFSELSFGVLTLMVSGLDTRNRKQSYLDISSLVVDKKPQDLCREANHRDKYIHKLKKYSIPGL